jgi:hypothetical protein
VRRVNTLPMGNFVSLGWTVQEDVSFLSSGIFGFSGTLASQTFNSIDSSQSIMFCGNDIFFPGNVDGREGRRCDSAAYSICASASRLRASAVQLDRILYWRQHWRGLGQS